jgi:hypothetical protein
MKQDARTGDERRRTTMVIIKKDNQIKAEVNNENEAFIWLLKHQGQSVDFAIKHNGWTVTDELGKQLWIKKEA